MGLRFMKMVHVLAKAVYEKKNRKRSQISQSINPLKMKMLQHIITIIPITKCRKLKKLVNPYVIICIARSNFQIFEMYFPSRHANEKSSGAYC